SGSCDLTVVDINSVVDTDLRPQLQRIDLTTASGQPIIDRPAAMVGDPRFGDPGQDCPAEPQGYVYIAYPDCHLVAVIDVASGQAVAGIQFAADGSVSISDGEVGCAASAEAAQCGAVIAETDDIAPRPVALDIVVERDGDGVEVGRRLYVAADNSSTITAVELDEDFLPAATMDISFEGDIGFTAIAASDLVVSQGELPFRFFYGVATDNTVRVAEVSTDFTECETQVDTRYLHSETDVGFLPCMPVGDPRTPPRRAGSRSPGIHVLGDAVPLDVEFAHIPTPDGVDLFNLPTDPSLFFGDFAYITLSSGQLMVVNVFDRHYARARGFIETQPDAEDYVPFETEISLALPHQPRDIGVERDRFWEGRIDGCDGPDSSTELDAYGPRLDGAPGFSFDASFIDEDKRHLLPGLRATMCTNTSENDVAVSELSIAAAAEVRQRAYPDWTGPRTAEQWNLRWEGPLSLDGPDQAIDGPAVRFGLVSVGDDEFELSDASAPFCQMGVEPFDWLELLGCDPGRGDSDCGVGEVCYVHPDAPSEVASGMCLDATRVDELASTCRDLLITRRGFAVIEASGDRLRLSERRRVLRTTPLEGCIDDDECRDLAAFDASLAAPEDPRALPDDLGSEYSWTCEADPSRAPGPPRCVMTCAASSECEPGYACSAGRCVASAAPPAECLSALQRYRVRASDAFVVIGQLSGYLHSRITDPDSGECVADPDAHPLQIGRIPLTAPPCPELAEGEDPRTQITPNPCLIEIDDFRSVSNYSDAECTPDESTVEPRTASAVRFRNPSFTFHMVDPISAGDGVCNGDRLGERLPVPVVYPDYQIELSLAGGLAAMRLTLQQVSSLGTFRLAFPIGISSDPLGNVWILDQGDRGSSINGQVVIADRPDSTTPSTTIFDVIYVQ
ncbi:MAG: hypothetical protein AAGC55_05360, partial [Myxococcota bacterium]